MHNILFANKSWIELFGFICFDIQYDFENFHSNAAPIRLQGCFVSASPSLFCNFLCLMKWDYELHPGVVAN